MRFAVGFLALLATVMAPMIQAFTNGTLLPSYLCGLPGDGYPKSLGGVLPYLQLGTILDAYNQFPPGAGGIPIQIAAGQKKMNKMALAPPAAQIIGAFHNGQPDTAYTNATLNPVLIIPALALSAKLEPIPEFVIGPNIVYDIVVITNAPFFNAANFATDGAFMYAMDTKTGLRVGSFENAGPNMQPWAACSLNVDKNVSTPFPLVTGIVHNQLLSGTSMYTGIKWRSPIVIQGNIAFVGAGVSDGGYGPVHVIYNTTSNQTAPPLATVIRTQP